MKILLIGNGNMGSILKELVPTQNIVGIINKANKNQLNDLKEDPDIIIDFSHPDNLEAILLYIKDKDIPLVIATTGHTKEQILKVNEYKNNRRILIASNFSYLVNILRRIIKQLNKSLGSKGDIHIIEKHHKQKSDKPSGTALMIKQDFLDTEYNSLEISSIRGSNINPEHEVILMFEDETLSIKHTINSKKVYAKNVLECSKILITMKNGIYSLDDILKEGNINEKL